MRKIKKLFAMMMTLVMTLGIYYSNIGTIERSKLLQLLLIHMLGWTEK